MHSNYLRRSLHSLLGNAILSANYLLTDSASHAYAGSQPYRPLPASYGVDTTIACMYR
jgi:hypothetical protein